VCSSSPSLRSGVGAGGVGAGDGGAAGVGVGCTGGLGGWAGGTGSVVVVVGGGVGRGDGAGLGAGFGFGFGVCDAVAVVRCVTTVVLGTMYTGRGACTIRVFGRLVAGLWAGGRVCTRTVTCRAGVVMPIAAVGSTIVAERCGTTSSRSAPAIGSTVVLVATKTTPAGARSSGTHSKRTRGTVTAIPDA
jgi:hypothetical protein